MKGFWSRMVSVETRFVVERWWMISVFSVYFLGLGVNCVALGVNESFVSQAQKFGSQVSR